MSMYGCPAGYEELPVRERQTVEHFLQRHGFPGTKARILLGHARLWLLEIGMRRVLLNDRHAAMALFEGDRICIPLALPAACSE
ncbi:MAG: hypothetical protein JW768_03240, partial [Chitinispirillaceae bacterium]|nr:hypothetical protein [Chitinispirillaceae bacterium]